MAIIVPCVWMIGADEAGKQAVVKLKALLLEDGLLKGLTGTQSPIVIRSSTYKLLALICKRCAAHLLFNCLQPHDADMVFVFKI